jgi:hypothetical protein
VRTRDGGFADRVRTGTNALDLALGVMGRVTSTTHTCTCVRCKCVVDTADGGLTPPRLVLRDWFGRRVRLVVDLSFYRVHKKVMSGDQVPPGLALLFTAHMDPLQYSPKHRYRNREMGLSQGGESGYQDIIILETINHGPRCFYLVLA